MPATVQKPSAPTLPETGFLRLSDVLRFVPVCRTAWEFAREIEHSDQNLDFLEEIFSVSELYFPENFLPGLVAGKEVRL